jgi:hypothetical protein
MRHISAIAAAAALITLTGTARAGGTRFWEVRTASEFSEGKLDGAIVGSKGHVAAGWSTKRHELKVDAVWSLLADGRGGALIGTGYKGEIHKISGDEVKRIAETGEPAVTVMRRSPDGVLVGTIPSGKIFILGDDGTLADYLTLDAEYIWDIAVAPDGTIYVATGPKGKLFRIVNKKPELWLKSDEQNLLSLALTPGGALYAGSGEKGLLYRVTGKDSAVVVYDFDENEVRSIAVGDDYLLLAANAAKSKGGTTKAATDTKPAAGDSKKNGTPPPSKEPMDCAVYKLATDGNIEPLFASKGEFIWNLSLIAGGQFLVATGDKGRIYRGSIPAQQRDPVIEGESADVLFDLKEGQALALAAEFGELMFVGTGNGGAIYTVSPKSPGKGEYISKVLDAKHVASWGRAEWKSSGTVTIETRSGATAEPDDAWNKWQAIPKDTGTVTSPRARYLQFRATVSARDAMLREMRIAYLPDNQRPKIEKVEVIPVTKGKEKSPKTSPTSPILPTHATALTIKWTASDPDGDELASKLTYRLTTEKDDAFRPMNEGKPVAGDKFAWETLGLPDGRYIVRVTTSDERDNPAPRSRSAARDSDPILVDHTPPKIENIVVANGEVRGTATDAASIVAHLSWLLDGGKPKLLPVRDGLLDSHEEEFLFPLPKGLAPGTHSLAVQCADKAGNLTVVRVEFKTQ